MPSLKSTSTKADEWVRSFSFLLQTRQIVTPPLLSPARLPFYPAFIFFQLSISDFLHFTRASFKLRQGCR